MHRTKISAEFEFGGHSPLVAHPKNVAFGYEVGKISSGWLVASCIRLNEIGLKVQKRGLIDPISVVYRFRLQQPYLLVSRPFLVLLKFTDVERFFTARLNTARCISYSISICLSVRHTPILCQTNEPKIMLSSLACSTM